MGINLSFYVNPNSFQVYFVSWKGCGILLIGVAIQFIILKMRRFPRYAGNDGQLVSFA